MITSSPSDHILDFNAVYISKSETDEELPTPVSALQEKYVHDYGYKILLL
jgi:hypothetical protein